MGRAGLLIAKNSPQRRSSRQSQTSKSGAPFQNQRYVTIISPFDPVLLTEKAMSKLAVSLALSYALLASAGSLAPN
jgi:hypothetical protein